LGILAAIGQIPSEPLSRYEIAGELALPGELRPIRGAMAMTYHKVHKTKGAKRAYILPQLSALEAGLVKDAIIYPANSLLEVCAHLSGHIQLNEYQSKAEFAPLV